MIRKLVATASLLLTLCSLAAPVSPAAAGGGPSDYADCVVTVSPSTFGPGATITVSGTGLQPTFEVAIEFDSTEVVGTAITDASGSFVTTVEIPADAAPGAHTITAVCDASGSIGSSSVLGVQVDRPGTPGTEVDRPGAPGTGANPLPRTGSDIEPLLVAGGAAVLAGVAFVLVAKRRRSSAVS